MCCINSLIAADKTPGKIPHKQKLNPSKLSGGRGKTKCAFNKKKEEEEKRIYEKSRSQSGRGDSDTFSSAVLNFDL